MKEFEMMYKVVRYPGNHVVYLGPSRLLADLYFEHYAAPGSGATMEWYDANKSKRWSLIASTISKK